MRVDEFRPVEQTDAVRAARAAQRPAIERRQRLEHEMRRLRSTIGAAAVNQSNEPTADAFARMEAVVRLPRAEAEHDAVVLECMTLQREVDATRASERAKLAQAIEAKMRPAVKQFARALKKAAAANAVVAALDQVRIDLLTDGYSGPMLHNWPELNPSDSGFTSRLDLWLAQMSEHGLDVDE